MSLIVETGAAMSNAEAYISVADATTYHAARANAAWAAIADDATREAYLRRATEYMSQVYRERWAGYRKTATQALDWPRQEVPFNDAGGLDYYDDETVPLEVQRACAELALRASAGELSPDIGRLTKREKVDVIEVEYSAAGVAHVQFRAIDNLLAPLLKAGVMGGACVGLIRV